MRFLMDDMLGSTHRVALFSAFNFQQFDEDRFWSDFEKCQETHPYFHLSHYRKVFERQLTGEDAVEDI